jgi:RNA ligase (TIGR02306 family)
MSRHEALCYELKEITKHPNADNLGLVNINGYSCVVRLDEFAVGDKAIYLSPDTVVDTKLPSFTFLDGHERIRVRKFRGLVSQGLLIKAGENAVVGQDYWDLLGLDHYEPEEKLSTGATVPGPVILVPKYDIDSLLKYNLVFQYKEPVEVSSKIHGSNWRGTFWDGVLYVGSRSTWKKDEHNNIYWRVIAKYPEITDYLMRNEGKVLYGEVFGRGVQDLHYGLKEIDFRAFDVYDSANQSFLDKTLAMESTLNHFIPWVHSYGIMEFDLEQLKELAEQDDPIALQNGIKQVQEGVVIRPLRERFNPELGRVILKLVSNRYYLKE